MTGPTVQSFSTGILLTNNSGSLMTAVGAPTGKTPIARFFPARFASPRARSAIERTSS